MRLTLLALLALCMIVCSLAISVNELRPHPPAPKKGLPMGRGRAPQISRSAPPKRVAPKENHRRERVRNQPAVKHNACYFRVVPSADDNGINSNFFDRESRMAADIFSHTLRFQSDDDSRIITFEPNNGGTYNRAIDIVGAKVFACVSAGKKIMFNFHASGNAWRFLHKVIRAYWLRNRGGVAETAVATRVLDRPVINVASCKPVDFTNYERIREFLLDVAAVNRRQEYCEWLFGPRCNANGYALLEAEYASRNQGQEAAAQALQNLNAANLPAPTPIIQYPAGVPVGWVSNVLMIRENQNDRMRLLAHNGFASHDTDAHGGQRKHHLAKEACYAVYPYTATDTTPAVTTSNCIKGVVYHVSSSGVDRAKVGTPGFTNPVFTTTWNDVNMATAPRLLTMLEAWPDLTGCERVYPTGQHGFTSHRKANVLTAYKDKKKIAQQNGVRTYVEAMPNILLERKRVKMSNINTQHDEDEAEDEDEDEGEDEGEDEAEGEDEHEEEDEELDV